MDLGLIRMDLGEFGCNWDEFGRISNASGYILDEFEYL